MAVGGNTMTTKPPDPQSLYKTLGTIAKIASPPHPSAQQEEVLQRFYAQSLSRELLPDERVALCLRALRPGHRTVEIVHDAACQRAHYKNLVTCGRLWFCPVCASRITEKRAQELFTAVNNWQQDSGFVALITFTLRHHQDDPLETLVDALRDAYRRFKAGAPWQRIQERYGWHGSVTALEVTFGENGWHPHLHVLGFFQPLASSAWASFPDVVKQRWINVLAAAGRDATWEHGVDVRDAQSDVYDYVAKYGRMPKGSRWTLDREVAKSPTKKAGKDGFTPWELLIRYGEGNQAAGKLFQEYARVFKGRNQLTWSSGLRAELLIGEEQSDEDIAAELPDDLALLASLTKEQWRTILRLKRDVRGELLHVAGSGDRDVLIAFLALHGVYVCQAASHT